MLENIFSYLATALVAVSISPLLYRTWQRKIEPAFYTWFLWSIIGLALLISYSSYDIQYHVLPSFFGWLNPTAMAILIWLRFRTNNKLWLSTLTITERIGGGTALVAIVVWFCYQTTQPLLALVMALIANSIASWPTIVRAFKKPNLDRPVAWIMFTLGFALSTYVTFQGTITEWILPAYMTILGGVLAFQLTWYRLKMQVPWRDWL